MAAFRSLGRFWTIAWTLGRYDALIPREYAGKLPVPVRMLRVLFGSRHEGTPGARLTKALEKLGPTAIKLGQLLATRPDVVGAETARALSALQDRLPAFPTLDAQAVVAQDLGCAAKKLFAEFGDPVAAASIAQVHVATTRDSPPRKVAVKVLRPGIKAEMTRDLEAFAFAARWAERMSAEARRLRFTAVVETLAASVAVELDLRMEAAAMAEYAENLDDDAFHVPAVDWAHTGEHVLTMEWIDGVPARDRETLTQAGLDPKAIAAAIARRSLQSALCDGYFHADMHPGNLLIEPSGRISMVDFGIMGRLDERTRRFMAEVLTGFLTRDYLRAARAHFAYGTVAPTHSVDLFAQGLRAIVAPIFGRPIRDISMAILLQQLFETTRRFGMQTQPQLLLLQKTMVVVEGVARSLDPDFDMWAAAGPVVESWLREHSGPSARLREMADLFRTLAAALRERVQDAASEPV